MTHPPRRLGALLLAPALLLAAVVGAATPAFAAGASVTDTFTRTVANGLGTADSGGAWTLAGTASRFAVTAGRATISTPAGGQYAGYLTSTPLRDTDVTATLGLSALPVGSSAYIGVLARHSGSSDYTGRVIVGPSGAVAINLLANASSLKLASVPGVTLTAGTVVHVRLQAIGANPTTLQARAWKDGTAEPTTWQVSATDSTAALQAPGAAGVRTYLSSSVTNGPITGTVDDFTAAAPTPPNLPPTAAFSAVPTDLAVAFDATGSADPDGTITAYAWSFGDGTTGSGATQSHAYAASGTYTTTLTVTDDAGATAAASKDVTVTAPVAAPVAAFTPTTTARTVSVDASASTGSITGYAWSFGDGTTATGPTATHTYDVDGTDTITLTVTDATGRTDTVTHDVTVAAAPANQAPTAAFTPTAAGLTVSVDASASSDPDGSIASYAWSFGDGGTATGVTATHTFATGGTFTVTLVVTDDGGATATAQQQVTVVAPNRPPVASILLQQGALVINFWADRSADPDGSITAYAWNFGDGKTSTAAVVNHGYPAAGTYLVTLTVTDNGGATTTVTRSVTLYGSGVRPTQAQWLTDVNNSIAEAADYLDTQTGVVKPAIVLDIDNTAIQSYYQSSAPTPAVLAVAQRAVADGYKVFVATGRTADGGSTLRQLRNAGYQVDGLCFYDKTAPSIQASKTACRNGWAAQGYTIVEDIGNHTTDLTGGNSGRQYLLPNYAFLD